MRIFFSVFLVFISVAAVAQQPADDFFKPYKYPKHYSFDGAFRILEFSALLPAGDAGYGGYLKVDFASVKLGTHAIRLNFGFGLGYTSAGTKTMFAPTPLIDGTMGENYITDHYGVPHIQLYPRLWIRILNPLNLSVTGGPSFYMRSNTTNGHFSVHDNGFYDYAEHELELEAKSTNVGINYFIEAKGMLNFRNWGVSGGFAKQFNGYNHGWQPVIGLWFGLKVFEPVVN